MNDEELRAVPEKNPQGVDGNGFLSAGCGRLGAKCFRRVEEEMNGRCPWVGVLTHDTALG